MELFEMFYHILRFLKLRSSCSFCFQMLGFLIRAKHCECSDILQIFVPHYLEEPCRVMVRRRTTGAATLCCSGHFTSSPNLNVSLSKIKTVCLLTGTIYPRKHFSDQLLSLKHTPYSCHDYHRPPHHRPSTIYRAFFERSSGKFYFLFLVRFSLYFGIA